jgi:hypothetical protein
MSQNLSLDSDQADSPSSGARFTSRRSTLASMQHRDCLSDDVAAGRLRAFSLSHRHHKEVLEREFERQSKDQERMRKWAGSRGRRELFQWKPQRDKGIIEDIARHWGFNRTSMTATDPLTKAPGGQALRLPKENRAIYAQTPSHIFYWGI